MDFNFRGVELHSSRMWQLSHIERTLAFMQRHQMNALLLHQNDMVDQLVFPHAIFSDSLMWQRWPVRMHTIYNNRKYLNKIISDAQRAGISVYLEVKELSFPEAVFETVPGLVNAEGKACPQNPFWWELLRMRFEELCEAVPHLGGVVVSAGTRESRLSIASGGCGCEACAQADRSAWYTQLTSVIWEVLDRHGMQLIMRDFSYSAQEQGILIDAVQSVSDTIGIAMKVTPHDFYPTFPTNPKIGMVERNPQFVEFDTWGQFFGLGVFPSSIAEDMAQRLVECKERGVGGVWFRTDWEVMFECSTANSLNMVNLYAGALLAQDIRTPLEQIYRTWVAEGQYSPLRSGSYAQEPQKTQRDDAHKSLRQIMELGWEIMRTSSYVRGHVFMEDDQIPDSVERAYDMMVRIHGRDAWDPGASALVAPTEENLRFIREEKATSIKLAEELAHTVRTIDLGFTEEFSGELIHLMDLYVLYVRMIAYASDAVFTTAIAAHDRSMASVRRAHDAIVPLEDFLDELAQLFSQHSYPHYIHWLLDELRVRKLIDDCTRILCTIPDMDDMS